MYVLGFKSQSASRRSLSFCIPRTARMQLTDELIGDLSVSSTAGETSNDIEKIQELLSLPQNEDVTQDSSSQSQ